MLLPLLDVATCALREALRVDNIFLHSRYPNNFFNLSYKILTLLGEVKFVMPLREY